MKPTRMPPTTVALTSLLLFARTPLAAAGYAVPTQDVRSAGLMLAVTARSDHPSLLMTNPAGLARQDQWQASLGGLLYLSRITVTRQGRRESQQKDPPLIPHLFAGAPLARDTAIGVGVYAPYGMGSEWAPDWSGRYLTTSSDLRVICYHAGIGTRLGPVRLGAGLRLMDSSADIGRRVDAGLALYRGSGGATPTAWIADPTTDSAFRMQGDATGWGYNLGLQWDATPRLSTGISFTSSVDLDYQGTSSFTHADAWDAVPLAPGSSAGDLLRQAMPASQGGDASLRLPAALQFGLLYQASDRLDLSLDLHWVRWSDYQELAIDLDQDRPADRLVSDKDWRDASSYRLGSSYRLSDRWVLRAGAKWDETPVPDHSFDPQVPDTDRIALALGAGWQRDHLTIDLAYVYSHGIERDKDNLVGYVDINGDGQITATDAAALDTLAGGAYPTASGRYGREVHVIGLSASWGF